MCSKKTTGGQWAAATNSWILSVASFMAVRYSCRPALKLALDGILAAQVSRLLRSEIVIEPTIFLSHIL